MSGRSKQAPKQSEISPETLRLQEKFQEHLLKRLEEGLSHHTTVFDMGVFAFWWSFIIVYVPLTFFLMWGVYALFCDFSKLEVTLKFLTTQGAGISFAVLCAFPLAILMSLSKHNRIDAGKEDSGKMSDYIPTSGIFEGL